MKRKKVSTGFVGIAILLMASFIFVQLSVFDFFEYSKVEVANKDFENANVNSSQSSEAGMYNVLKNPSYTAEFNDGPKKSSDDYYSRRAYTGAPPSIPHKIKSAMEGGIENCLHCHKNGGHVKEMQTYAPRVPHPELINCNSCHVPKMTTNFFKPSNWVKTPLNSKHGKNHLYNSPPTIPHTLQLRENCLSCHSGQGGNSDIRVTHPNRINCRQCHLPVVKNEVWERKAP